MSNDRKNQIGQNLKHVHENILAAMPEQDPQKLPRLICVSKNHPLSDILLANQLGETEFGENRAQELLAKKSEFLQMPQEEQAKYNLHWHFIGVLQRNKVKDIVGQVALIHSVHSLKLLEQIEKISAEKALVSEILLQLNLSKEESKHGFFEEELAPALEFAQNQPHLKLRGLMTMAPFYEADQVYKTEALFHRLRELLERHQEQVGSDFNQLSMGMSNDYQYAVKAGTTMLRIGTSIFGSRL